MALCDLGRVLATLATNAKHRDAFGAALPIYEREYGRTVARRLALSLRALMTEREYGRDHPNVASRYGTTCWSARSRSRTGVRPRPRDQELWNLGNA